MSARSPLPRPALALSLRPAALVWGWLGCLGRVVLTALLVSALTVIPFTPQAAPKPAWALSLPGLGGPKSSSDAPQALTPTPPGGRLQEVSPPVAVQQLQQGLAERLPQIEILSPRDGATLAQGPWQLKLRVRDWPLVDAGPLGLGPHVVVQIDDQPPQRLSGDGDSAGQTQSAAVAGDSQTLVLSQPALRPGSHRLTVYAARPWGEAVKSPGAVRQIRIHQLAANPQSLPAVGSPQLLPVSPDAGAAGEPLLLDWLLLDAPLQNLRAGDGSWRLKVTINGDTFLVDQAVPLWLRGWKSGHNSLQLELIDGFGEPLNPPFNSFVQAIELTAPGADGGSRPRWQQGRLSDNELAILLGEQPVPPEQPSEDPSAQDEQGQAQAEAEANPAVGVAAADSAGDSDGDLSQADPAAPSEPAPQPMTAATATETAESTADAEADSSGAVPIETVPAVSAEISADSHSEPRAEATAEPEAPGAETPTSATGTADLNQGPDDDAMASVDNGASPEALMPQRELPQPEAGSAIEPPQNAEAANSGATDTTEQPGAVQDNPDSETSLNDGAAFGSVLPEPAEPIEAADADAVQLAPDQGEPAGDDTPTGSPDSAADAPSEPEEPEAARSDDPPPAAEQKTLDIRPPERISSSTPLGGAARELVNPDGSLIQPPPQGPLSGLRQLLQRP